MQMWCVRWFDLQYPQFRLALHHSPNGGKRNAREGKRFKDMGTRAGFPDLIFLHPNTQYAGLAVEFKATKGRQTENQKDYQAFFTQMGWLYVVVRSFDEFQQVITNYLK